jgi:phenylacetate-CoA ligase
MIILRGVNVFPTQIEEQLMTVHGLAPHFQIMLTRPDRLDEMRVLVEAIEGFSGNEDRVHAAADMMTKIKRNVGVSVKVDVADPGTVERSQGKAVRIIDKRPKS